MRFSLLLIFLLAFIQAFLPGCSMKGGAATGMALVEEKWGIKVEGLRLTAEGHMCDFRFRVLDAAKAAPLLSRKSPASLINESTGTMSFVPAPPKVGPLRQTVKLGSPLEGRTYFIFFANPGKLIKPGTKATVSIGEFVLAGLEVQ